MTIRRVAVLCSAMRICLNLPFRRQGLDMRARDCTTFERPARMAFSAAGYLL